MDVTLCEKHGQSFFNDTGMKRCPDCQIELKEKIRTTWHERDHQAIPETSVAAEPRRREVWELNVQERLERLLKKIPLGIAMNDEVVESVRRIPIVEREMFAEDLNDLLHRLEDHHKWWCKVLEELNKTPVITVLKNK